MNVAFIMNCILFEKKHPLSGTINLQWQGIEPAWGVGASICLGLLVTLCLGDNNNQETLSSLRTICTSQIDLVFKYNSLFFSNRSGIQIEVQILNSSHTLQHMYSIPHIFIIGLALELLTVLLLYNILRISRIFYIHKRLTVKLPLDFTKLQEITADRHSM